MTHDLNQLRDWLRICLIIAAVCTTAFPFLYAFSLWYKTTLGRVLMLQAVAFALAIDLTVAFQYWEVTPDNLITIFWINALVFSLIAFATTCITVVMVRMNYSRLKAKKEREDGQRKRGARGWWRLRRRGAEQGSRPAE